MDQIDKPKKKKMILMFAFVFAIILLVFFFLVRPGIVGYTVYQDLKSSELTSEEYKINIEKLQIELRELSGNLTACQEFSADLSYQLDDAKEKIVECEEKIKELNTKIENLNKQIENLQTENKGLRDQIAGLTAEIKSLKEGVISNAAKNTCCKAKIDNPSIDSYSIENDKIVCKTGGEISISCSFA